MAAPRRAFPFYDVTCPRTLARTFHTPRSCDRWVRSTRTVIFARSEARRPMGNYVAGRLFEDTFVPERWLSGSTTPTLIPALLCT